MGRRVVITGLGAVSPCGNDVPTTWQALRAGRSAVGPITRFVSDLPVRIAAEVKGFDAEALLGRKLAKRLDLFAQFAVVAAREALSDAGIGARVAGEAGNPRMGVYIGSGIGGLNEIVSGARSLEHEGWRSISPFFIPRSLTNLAAGQVAIEYGAEGPSLCVTTACATGNHSIGEAWRAIRLDDADVVVAGGAEAAITPIGMCGFAVMKALSRRNDDPESASRPFDRDRDGFVMGEGAGMVVLEELEHARARGARIYAEVVGYALTNDAYHDTAPAPGGAGAARCMAAALRSAHMAPTAIDYINAHGTSTAHNDVNETLAIKSVFGDHARALLVSSTKSVTGHLLGAAGGLEAVATALALQTGFVPPTANLRNPDPECDLDYVPLVEREARPRAALSNAFGFGGTNATIVLRRWEG